MPPLARAALALVLLAGIALPADLSREIDRVLAWFPPGVQSLGVDQRSFGLPAPAADRDQSFFGTLERYMAKGIAGEDRSGLAAALSGEAIRYVVAGARPEPESGALVPFTSELVEGAWVYGFAHPVDGKLRRALERVPSEEISGVRVWRIEGQLRDEPGLEYSRWIAVPRPDVLVIATTGGFASALVRRAHAAGLHPPEWPEWKLVDRGAPFWAVRDSVASGSSAALLPARWSETRELARGYGFSVDGKGRVLRARRLLKQAAEHGAAPELLEVDYPLDGPGEAAAAALEALTLLEFAFLL